MLQTLAILIVLTTLGGTPQLELSTSYQVLQRDAQDQAQCVIRLAPPLGAGQSVAVEITMDGKTIARQVLTAAPGEHRDAVELRQLPMGGPYKIELNHRDARQQVLEHKSFEHVLVGDLWILAGQSNMEGVAPVERDFPALPTVNMLNLDNTWQPAVPPLHRKYEAQAPVFHKLLKGFNTEEEIRKNREQSRHVKPVGGTDCGYFFARKLAQQSGVPIGLIPCAFGGTSLNDWDPAGAGQGGNSLYGFMLERVKLAGGKVRGVLWYQGESEATESCLVEPNYKVRQRRLIEAVRRDLQAPQLPFLQAQIASFMGYEWKFAKKGTLDRPYEIIREFQRELAEEMEHVYTVATVDLDHWDLIHLSAAAQARLGERFAYLALPYSKAGVAPRQEIRLKSVRFTNTQRNQIAVEFTGVTGRLRAAGNPYGFEIFDPASGEYRDWVFRIDFDKANLARLILNFDFGITLPLDTKLYYAPHAFKYVNVLDENDMSLPAFGPAKIEPFVAQP